MTDTVKCESRRMRLADRYLAFLAIVLLGYALLGKGFAYLGFPPLYIGEIALLAGIVVFVSSGAWIGSFATFPSLVLVTAMTWVAMRTVPFLGVHGIDALRDAVVVLYGGFAFIVIALVLEDARRIDTVIRYYGSFLLSFPAIPLAFWLTRYWGDYLPKYGPNVPIVEIGASAVGTHLAGAAVFVLVGYRKVSWLWTATWFGTLAMIAATNRGATTAVLLAVAFAFVMLGKLRLMLAITGAGLVIFAGLLALEAAVFKYDEVTDSADRPVSAHQILENARSIVSESGQQTEGTKRWRLDWWDVIMADTLYGPNFWTGRGFGLNLAVADGFVETGDPSNPRPLTRSPHNAHMTVLARGGVPGIVLWSLVLLSWAGMMLHAMLVARSRGHKQWSNLFLWVFCYATAIAINATFDVALEGPMQGIWFWSLIGLGIGTVMVYRAQPPGHIESSDR
jgi:hypothetical protein